MARQLQDAVVPAGRSLLGYYGYNGYNNNGYSCSGSTGCLAGAIIGSVVFFLFAFLLLLWLLVRIRRQRAAALAAPAYFPEQGAPPTYYANQGGSPPQQYTGTGGGMGAYPAPSAYGPGGSTQQQGRPSGPAPTNFASDAQREQWEREQYEKYGEAGLVQGTPVGNGVQMSQQPTR